MKLISRFSSFLMLFAVVAIVVGCAHSPQSVKLSPTIETNKQTVGHGESMMVGFVDHMKGKPIGSRGGVYKESSLLSLDPNYQQQIHEQLKKGFAGLGYNTWVDQAADSEIQTIVTLSNLTFNRVKGNLLKTYQVDVTFQVEVMKGNKVYKNLYSEKGEQKYPKTPDGAAVAVHMNELISTVVQRMLSDSAMHDFLSEN